jgi:hypothetical protein
MPRFEHLLHAASETTAIAHGPGFWAEMGAWITPQQRWSYPKGPIGEEGATWHLLRTCPNLYADLSANSGHNAITRDPKAGVRFLIEFQDKLLFGTDTCSDDVRMPQQKYLTSLREKDSITPQVFDKIMSGNALRLLGAA